jgi:cobaltochelatase CobT
MNKRRNIISTVPEHGMKTEEFAMAQTSASRVFGRDRDAAVIFEGNQAMVRTDGTIVYPALAGGHQMSKDEILVARGFADHETGHKRYTDTGVMEEFNKECESSDNALLRQVAFAVDDIRIEKLAIRDYSGAQTNLEATNDAMLGEFVEFAKEHPEEARDLDVVMPVMMTVEGRRRMGYRSEHADDALAVLTDEQREKINAYVDIAMGVTSPDPVGGTREVIDAAKLIIDEKEKQEEQDDQPEDGEGLNPEGGDEGIPVEGGDDEGGGGSGDDEEREQSDSEGKTTGEHKEFTGELASQGKPLDADDLMSKAINSSFEKYIQPNSKHYRPYSTQYDSYSRADDLMVGMMTPYMKSRVESGSVRRYERIVKDMHGKISTMARKLERALMAKQRRDWQTNLEFGNLDPKRLVQAALGKDNVFRMRDDRKELDTAVSMVIDLSGSMHGRVFLAEQVAIALSQVLEKVGVAFEVVGFNNIFIASYSTADSKEYCTPGRYADAVLPISWMKDLKKVAENPRTSGKFSRFEPFQMYEFKSYDRKLMQERHGMGMIAKCVGGHNSDVEAVRMAATHLRHRPESRKIMFVLSDGLPEVTCTLGGSSHQLQHLRNEIERMGMHGIECVGLGIQSDAVSRFYPRYVIVNDINDLPKASFDQMAKMLVNDRYKVDNSDLMSSTGAR